MSDAYVPSERVLAARSEAVKIAKHAVDGSKDLLVALREVMALWPELDVDDQDEGLAGLLDVAAEIEDLPVGAERNAWPRKLLAEADREIADAKRLYRHDLIAAFRRLIQRFAVSRR